MSTRFGHCRSWTTADVPPGLVLRILGEPVGILGRRVVDPRQQAEDTEEMQPEEVSYNVNQLS
jgi:hypothetical protein